MMRIEEKCDCGLFSDVHGLAAPDRATQSVLDIVHGLTGSDRATGSKGCL